MSRSSTAPAQPLPTAPKHLRPELEVLVRALAALPEPERSEVYAAVNEEARRTRGPTLSWDEWEAARAVVSLGGDAVEDCRALGRREEPVGLEARTSKPAGGAT